jgi:serine/threonine-protein kinase
VEEVRRIMKETADALSAAHGLGVVHRDIKPDNILLEGTRGRVMVTDFGIAKALSQSSGATLTGAGVAIGTPSFMSPEQAAGEKEIDGRTDLYSLGIVAFQMLTGELPFYAPTVAGILMKQITEAAPDLRTRRPDAPEDLALAVSRCLEKDPQNRWPTADSLRRALENRSVTGYRPTGTGWKTSRTAPPAGGRPSGVARGGSGLRPPLERDRPRRSIGDARGNLPQRSPLRPLATDDTPLPNTGEPAIVLKVRAQFAKWAAISGGLFMINVATGIQSPWFLIPAAGMGIGMLQSYGKLWQAGYSWRDVLSRPPAPDAVETTLIRGGKLPRQLPLPKASDFGAQTASVLQAHGDRLAIYKLLDKLTPAERDMLPEIAPTVDALYERAGDLARTLHAMDTSLDTDGLGQVEERIAAVSREPDDAERVRRLALLEKQRQTLNDLKSRRAQVANHLESCVLALQNVRFDLLRLRSAGVAAVLGDLTQATQQAKALSRDVDHAIAAAGEVRELIR